MTVRALTDALARRLSVAGVPDADTDARLIVEHVLGVGSHAELLCIPDVPPDAMGRAEELCARRERGEPLQYLFGSWSFMGREYALGKGVLIPRDDTQVVVTAALQQIERIAHPRILDLCAGSGIIGITLGLSRPDADVTAVEKSGDALRYLLQNAASLCPDITIVHDALEQYADSVQDGTIDLVIANPPYIPRGELDSLQREIGYEPRMALDGGESGTDLLYAIIERYTAKLRDGGVIALEIGDGQAAAVGAMLTAAGYTEISEYRDIGGNVRAVTAQKFRK